MFFSIKGALAINAIMSMVLTSAFVPFLPKNARQSTKLNLQDEIADMIDRELYRQHHKKEYEVQQFEKQKTTLVSPTLSNYMDVAQDDAVDILRMRKDQRLAEKNPESYCADRCLSTGNCEVFEDFFELSALEVVKFCTDCVLSEDDEPCDIPEAALEKYTEEGLNGLRP